MSRAPVLFLLLASVHSGCGKANAVWQSGTPPRTESVDAPPAPDASPRVDFVSPLSGEKINAPTLAIRGTASDDTEGLKVSVSVDGQTWTDADVKAGGFEATLPLPRLDAEYLTVHARATDRGGHTLTALQQVQVDNVAPRVSIDAFGPTDAATWLAGRKLGGAVVDGSAVTLRLDKSDGQGLQPAAAGGGRWGLLWVAGHGEDHVAHTLVAEAVDDFGNVSTARADFRIDVVAPRLIILSPSGGARFNAQALAATAGAVAIQFQAADGDSTAFVRQTGSNAHLTSLEVVTLPGDDGRLYTVDLEALDGAGNKSTAQVQFTVDRVAPKVIRTSPPDGTVTEARNADIEFSEPMQPTGPGLDAVPGNVAGAWAANRRSFSVTQLPWDTSFTFTAGPLMDDFGNPLTLPAPWHARTPPQPAPSGTLVATGVTDFSAAADEDGVLTIVTQSGTVASIHRGDAATGAFAVTQSPGVAPGALLLASAHQTNDAAGAPVRISSARIGGAGWSPLLWWWLGGAVQPSPTGSVAWINTRGFSAEGAATGPIGYVRNSSYDRANALPVALSVRPDHVAGVDGRWEVVELRPSGFTRQSFGCDPASPQGPMVCGISPAFTQTGFGPDPRYSHAITRRCSFHVYNDGNHQRVMWSEPFVASCLLGSCPQAFTSLDLVADDLQLASHSPTTFLAARRTTGGVMVWEAVPDVACNPQWGQSGTLWASNVASFRPVRVGNKPGLVWLDTGGGLRVFAP